MISACTVSVFNVWHNGDGIFAFQDHNTGQLCPQRVYKTDSDYYLIRVDLFDKPVNKELVSMMERHITHRLAGKQLRDYLPSDSRKDKTKIDPTVFVSFPLETEETESSELQRSVFQ